MNDKNFDSFIKQSLDGHSSAVPNNLWKRIQAEKDFDPFVKEKLNNHNSPVPADMWQRIQDEKDFDTHIKHHLDNISSPVPTDMWQRINNEKDFDTHIKEKLDNHSSPVPASIWQRIRPEEKKRRPIIWWWAAAASLLLMVGIGASWYLNHRPSSVIISQQIKTPSANGSQANNSITALPNQSSSSSSPIRGHDSLTVPNANNTVTQSNPVTQHPTDPNNSVDPNISNPTNQQNIGNQQNTTQTSQAFLGRNKASNKANINSNFKHFDGGSTNNWKGGNNAEANNLPPNTSVVESGNTNSDHQNLLNGNTFNENEKQLLLNNLIRSSIASNQLMPKQLLRADKKLPSIVCPTIGPPARNDWYVEAFLSPDYVQKNLQDKPNGKNIKTGMDSTLHRQVSFSAGVNIVKNIGDNFLIKTGVQYSQVNELFKYNSGSDTRTTTIITTRDVIIAPGDTIHIRDTSTVTQTGTLTKQNQNRYKQWDIPIIFGYEFGGKGFRLNANAGVIANIRSSYQGNMLDTTQKVIDIASYNNTGVYKTNIGLGVYLGLGILKPINDNMDLLIEPHARFNLSNMTTDAAIFNQKNTILGLSVGIRYKINGRGQRY